MIFKNQGCRNNDALVHGGWCDEMVREQMKLLGAAHHDLGFGFPQAQSSGR